MDRKTLFSSLFAATVVAGAVVKTTVDPDLRGLFVRMVSPKSQLTASRPYVPRPSAWPEHLELVVDPSLVAPMHAWGTGSNYKDAETPLCGDVELVELSATAPAAGDLLLRFRVGDWSCYQYFVIRIERSPASAPTIQVEARWWVDIGTEESLRDGIALLGVVGRVTIDSLDWTSGHDIAVKLALGCDFDKPPADWCWIEGGGTTTIRAPK
jgi:hypothetical protein